jgi:hypothetical protein
LSNLESFFQRRNSFLAFSGFGVALAKSRSTCLSPWLRPAPPSRSPHGKNGNERRPEGAFIKHRLNRNSAKMYDKALVLRVETTINNPSEFKVFRRCFKEGSLRRQPMRKGVSDFWRFSQQGPTRCVVPNNCCIG